MRMAEAYQPIGSEITIQHEPSHRPMSVRIRRVNFIGRSPSGKELSGKETRARRAASPTTSVISISVKIVRGRSGQSLSERAQLPIYRIRMRRG